MTLLYVYTRLDDMCIRGWTKSWIQQLDVFFWYIHTDHLLRCSLFLYLLLRLTKQMRDTLSFVFYIYIYPYLPGIVFFFFFCCCCYFCSANCNKSATLFRFSFTHPLPIYGTLHLLLFCVDFFFLDRSASATRFFFFFNISVPIYM